MRGGYGRPLTSIDVLGLCLRLGRRGSLDLVLEGGRVLPSQGPFSHALFFTRTFVPPPPQAFLFFSSFLGPRGLVG